MFSKRKEKKIEFETVSKRTVAKPGMKFLCTENVVMNSTKEIAYVKGKVYTCEIEGCLTDEQYSFNHETPVKFLAEFFKVKKN